LAEQEHPNRFKPDMTARNAYAVLLSAFFLIEGAWGLFSRVVFGGLTTNHLHAVIHIALAGLGLWSVGAGRVRGYLLFVGLLLVLVGGLWFVPGLQDLIVRLFNVNAAVAILNLVVGVASILMRFVASHAEARVLSRKD
jgi:hypothetical protein